MLLEGAIPRCVQLTEGAEGEQLTEVLAVSDDVIIRSSKFRRDFAMKMTVIVVTFWMVAACCGAFTSFKATGAIRGEFFYSSAFS